MNSQASKIIYLKRELRHNKALADFYNDKYIKQRAIDGSRLKEINRLKAYIKELKAAGIKLKEKFDSKYTYSYNKAIEYCNRTPVKNGQNVWAYNGDGSIDTEAVEWRVVIDDILGLDLEMVQVQVM